MLIDDILLYAELEAGEPILERFDFDLACFSFRLELAAEIPQRLSGDPRRLRRVLVNLADNAVRFTDQGEVGLRVGYRRDCLGEKRYGVRISVSDTGCGIPGDKINRIFQGLRPARRLSHPPSWRCRPGLAISRGLIASMGGEMQVKSEKGRGSVFTVLLPLGP